MAPNTQHVRVGVGVFVLASSNEPFENPRFLAGKRLGSHGAGTWGLSGGHMEFGETPEECAARETLEETGLRIKNIRFMTAVNSYMPEINKHFITLFMVCERASEQDEVVNMEPHKCEKWEWISWQEFVECVDLQDAAGEDALVERRFFSPMQNLLKQRPGVKPTSV